MSGQGTSPVRLAALGAGFIAVLLALAGLSVAIYDKALPWQQGIGVALRTSQPGLELGPGSDVKLQGRIVGRVVDIESDGRVATIHLLLARSEVHLVPLNVDAAIVPKTLFGEKYVDLIRPADPAPAQIRPGTVITQSRTSVELGALYAKLVPLLKSVNPADLSTILSTLDRALAGRGAELGRTFTQADGFLRRLNPDLGTMTSDLRKLNQVLEIYTKAAPDVLHALADSTAISSDLLVPHEQDLATLLDTVTTTADTTKGVAGANAAQIIRLTGRVRPLLALLHEYATVLPCSLKGLGLLDKLGNQVTGGRGPWTLLNVDLAVMGDPYTWPDDSAFGAHSDANDHVLPNVIPNWKPHCPHFDKLTLQVKDAAPLSLQHLPHQGVNPSAYDRSPGSSPSTATALTAVLAGGHTSNLAALLVAPMAYDGEVRVS